jgi:hypothetical protein
MLCQVRKLCGWKKLEEKLKKREAQTLFVVMLQTATTKTEFLFIPKYSYFKQKVSGTATYF